MRDVAIIGYGPVGAALALALARYGLTVSIIEKTGAAYGLPRAVQIDDEVMRLFRTLGVDEAIRAETHVNPGTKFIAPDGRVLIDWSRPAHETPLGWNASYRFHQPSLEAVLREAIDDHPLIETRLMADAVQIANQEADVAIALAGGETVRARYAVGCDGAKSQTRKRIGATWEDLGFCERWLVLDLVVEADAPDFGRHTLQVCDPDHPTTAVCGVGQRRRFEFRLDEDESEEDARESAWRRLAPYLTRDQARLERVAVYEFRSCIADKWREGRIFLAGDAAHLTPPFMGQGLCAGFRDVANLAWKLAAVARGGGDALLDTYQTERAPHVREYIDLSVAMGRFINRTGAAALEGRSELGEDGAKLGMIRPALGPGLGPRDEIAGRLAPHHRLPGGRRLEDEMAGGFAVIAQHGFDTEKPGLKRIETDPFADWLRSIDRAAAIVRPDGYVLAAVRDEAALDAAAELISAPPPLTVFE